jgi:hypothetical protein
MNWGDPTGRGKSGGGEKCTMGWERDSHVVESLLFEWKLCGPTFGGCLLALSRCNKGFQDLLIQADGTDTEFRNVGV